MILLRSSTLLRKLQVFTGVINSWLCFLLVTLAVLSHEIFLITFTDDISVHGPMTQSQFLGSLGINLRVEALLQNCTEEQAESLRTGYWRLVGDGEAPFWEGPEDQTPIGMGTRYLAMAIVNKMQGTPIPFE